MKSHADPNVLRCYERFYKPKPVELTRAEPEPTTPGCILSERLKAQLLAEMRRDIVRALTEARHEKLARARPWWYVL